MSSKKDGTNRTGGPKPEETVADAPSAAPAPEFAEAAGTGAGDAEAIVSTPAETASETSLSEPFAPSEARPAAPAEMSTEIEAAPEMPVESEPAPAVDAPVEEVASAATAETTAAEPAPGDEPAAEPAADEAAANEIVPPAAAIAPAPSDGGFGRLVAVAALSTVLGGALGVGGSQFLAARDDAATRGAVKAEIDAGLARSAAKIAELEARIAALPKAPDPAPMEKRLAALEGERVNTGNLTERVGAVEKTLREQIEAAGRSVAAALAAVPADGSTKAALEAMAARLDAGLAAAKTEGAETAASVKALGERLGADFDRRATEAAKVLDGVRTRLGALESLRGDVDGLIGRIGGVEEVAKTLKATGTAAFEKLGRKTDEIAQKLGGVDGRLGSVETSAAGVAKAQAGAVLAVALADLKSAVDAGRPFRNEFDVVRRAGTLDLKVLEPFADAGVPSLTALRERLPKVTRTIAEVDEASVAGDGVVDRLVAHARQIVRIRPAGTAAGDTVEARLSRLEAKTRAGDLAGALAEWKGLPEASRKPVADWGTALEARVEVDRALARETAAVLAELSKSSPAR